MADDFLSDEDKALFREHMHQVKPLKERDKCIQKVTQTLPIKPKKSISPTDSTYKKQTVPQGPYLSDFISDTVLSDTVLSYCHSSIPNKRFRALKMGEIPWEARLDLHGFKIEAARDALIQFIHAQIYQNKRCLLIIHGKGGHQGSPPLIKNLINRWLPQFDEVLAFHSALAKDGGRGAVYVLLKKTTNL